MGLNKEDWKVKHMTNSYKWPNYIKGNLNNPINHIPRAADREGWASVYAHTYDMNMIGHELQTGTLWQKSHKHYIKMN